MDYWKECITEAFEDAGIIATQDQIDTVACWADGAHENYGMATGNDFISNPLDSEIEELKRKHKKELEERDNRELIYKGSVAKRRNIPVQNVYIDGNDVCYYK